MIRVLILRLLCLALVAVALVAGPVAHDAGAGRMTANAAMDHAKTDPAPCCPVAGHHDGKDGRVCAVSCAVAPSVLPDPVLMPLRLGLAVRQLPDWSPLPASRHPPPEDRPPRRHPAA
ncbi:hypothetical protein LV780_17780 [Cereibacter azotoformans]|uniref:CopL family metal-binding regulatory protein n=1 Tax=Cereibacter azotoformans TaxID=43057 RepID=A0A2T5K5X0_9RHOB|nr:hypothetical protein [Cereibacter azotoformans]PTR17748.1 hypothetical protein C8J28_11134 [Cereibacter azotoformans]UIJ32193.1 hypothetical protein LV780_17780 [Cereibacter azotoformans]